MGAWAVSLTGVPRAVVGAGVGGLWESDRQERRHMGRAFLGEVQSLVPKGMSVQGQVPSWQGRQCVGRGGLWAEQTLHRVGAGRKRR